MEDFQLYGYKPKHNVASPFIGVFYGKDGVYGFIQIDPEDSSTVLRTQSLNPALHVDSFSLNPLRVSLEDNYKRLTGEQIILEGFDGEILYQIMGFVRREYETTGGV